MDLICRFNGHGNKTQVLKYVCLSICHLKPLLAITGGFSSKETHGAGNHRPQCLPWLPLGLFNELEEGISLLRPHFPPVKLRSWLSAAVAQAIKSISLWSEMFRFLWTDSHAQTLLVIESKAGNPGSGASWNLLWLWTSECPYFSSSSQHTQRGCGGTRPDWGLAEESIHNSSLGRLDPSHPDRWWELSGSPRKDGSLQSMLFWAHPRWPGDASTSACSLSSKELCLSKTTSLKIEKWVIWWLTQSLSLKGRKEKRARAGRGTGQHFAASWRLRPSQSSGFRLRTQDSCPSPPPPA